MNRLVKILRAAKKKRKYFDQLDNILFLDYDGVINTDINNYGQLPFNKVCIDNVNRLCKEYNLKIVVISSWKKYANYIDILYESGLDKDITIIGKTDILNGSREEEIKQYLYNNIYINKFIIIDDGDYDELSKYQVKTNFNDGFNDDKYLEASSLLK